MATAFAKEAVRCRALGHLSDELIARATGAAPSTVRGWLTERTEPSRERAERINELAEIVDRLARVINPEYVPVWLTKPVAALKDEKPIDLVAQGRYIEVLRLISALDEPGAA